jgi:ectoine hydroxylase-related dioxygenase (phytanoyl-CoA dioxygenase family)
VSAAAGYAIYEGVFSSVEMGAVLHALSRAVVRRSRAGARQVLAIPAVRAIATDRRLMTIASSYVGPGATPFRATLFDKSPDANWLVTWHQDTTLPLRERIEDGAWGPWSTKAGVLHAKAPAWALEQVIALRISLDDSTHENGPLRVLPGSHLNGVLSDDQIRQLSERTVPVDCVVAAGGVVAMRPLTVHASSKAGGGQSRRVLHLECSASVDLGRGVPLRVE